MATSTIKYPTLASASVQLTDSTYGSSSLGVIKSGRVAELYGYFEITVAVPAYKEIITLPQGFIPSKALDIFLDGDKTKWLYGITKLSTQNNVLPIGKYYISQTYLI